MRFYIVTPSFNQINFLRRCVVSVADQVVAYGHQRAEIGRQRSDVFTPITIHHHIQDGGSTDGTVDWLRQYDAEVREGRSEGGEHQANSSKLTASGYTFSFASEADEGMYDAINKGWVRGIEDTRHEASGTRGEIGESAQSPKPMAPASEATDNFHKKIGAAGNDSSQNGETILAHLNCDEQYLSGGLQTIADFFCRHPAADVVLADMIVVNNDGAYICHRRSLKPHAFLSRICCVGMTTTTFQRASVVRDRQVLFDTSWRNIGDMVWYNALHQAGVRFAICNELVSLFTDTGENLNLTEEALRERKRYAKEYLFGMRIFTRLLSKVYSLRRYLKEFYLKPPTEYALYWNDLTKREMHPIERPTGLWHRKGVSAQQS